MAPSPMAVSGLLRQVIQYHLDNASFDNALFFAERFVAQDPRSTDATYLHALCHLRLGDFRSAYDIGKPMGYRGTNLGCIWVFAQACLALERFRDGISALEKSKVLWSSKSSIGKSSSVLLRPNSSPDTSAVLCLLGKLYRGYDDKKKAAGAFEEALKLNPFQWDAFTALCDMGVSVRVANVFRSPDLLVRSLDPEASAAVARTQSNAGSSNSLDAAPKKSALRNLASDLASDPFNVGLSLSESASPMADVFSEPLESDLMAKVHNIRSRFGASKPAPLFDGIETPSGPTATDVAGRMIGVQEAPQAPVRRMRQAQGIDSGLEAPPRMNYRLNTKRNTRSQDRDNDSVMEPIPDVPVPAVSTTRVAAVSTADRKRTLSGHPVSRAANADESGTRRSARLTNIKSSSRANSGATTIGTSAGRELKKARPPISRIVRPGSSGANVGRVVSGNRKPIDDHADIDHGETSRVREPANTTQTSAYHPPQQSKTADDGVKLEEAMRWMMDMMKRLGNGYYLLSRFQCQDALQAFNSLPSAHQGTPWVLAQMGRAHYEQASYAEAEKFFRRMRMQAPSRLQDMEVYSTILWHLKRETDLSFLAHELVDSAWHSPQAWCTLGNAWSLAKDPEQALKCFKRATQLDPNFAYAFTLQGHEHVTNEEYEQALTAYRQAISADKRHYSAYYGIGRVQERLGDYDKALTHFQAAQSINPNNAVLVSCIGTVLERQKQIVPALRAFSKAVELAPRAALMRYKKAHALLAIGHIEEAEKELVILKDLAPNEGHVHFLLGTLYRSMNERQLAVRHFTIALALDPKAGPMIKEAIERFEDDLSMDDSIMT